MNLTQNQQLIMDEVPALITSGDSVLIEARAGAGKTFILTQLAPALPAGGRCLAFNKAIATELQTKLPDSCPASTFHSLGFQILRERVAGVKSDTRKLYTLATKLKLSPTKPYTEVVSAMKIAGLGLHNLPPASPENIEWIIDTKNIELPSSASLTQFISDCQTLFKKSLKDFKTIDFDDMLYLPLHLSDKFKWKFDRYPYLMVDEAQDVSPLRLEMVKRLTDCVIAVGDPYQAIYGFAGALTGALDDIAKHFKTRDFLLPHSFRCPSHITAHATSILPGEATIASLPDNIGGEIIEGSFSAFPLPTSPNQAVLARMNLPLFILALKMLRNGQPFNFRSDFPNQLIAFVKRFKAETNRELTIRLEAWYEEEHEKLSARKRKGALAVAKEKYDTINYLATQCENPKAILLTLETICQPEGNAPTLSTIHKAKGLEWKHVYLLRPDQIPAPFATEPDELAQENNLHYVAVTRAVESFTYLHSGEK